MRSPRGAGDAHPRIERQQQRRAIADRRRGREIAAQRRAIANQRRREQRRATRATTRMPARVDLAQRAGRRRFRPRSSDLANVAQFGDRLDADQMREAAAAADWTPPPGRCRPRSGARRDAAAMSAKHSASVRGREKPSHSSGSDCGRGPRQPVAEARRRAAGRASARRRAIGR